MPITEVTVRSDSGHTYKIKIEDGHPIWCSCPGYRFAKGQSQTRTCKHVAALIQSGVGVNKGGRK